MTGKEVIRHEDPQTPSASGAGGVQSVTALPALGQGVAIDLTRVAPDDRHRAFTEACDYRGDITLELTDGSTLECFMFDRRPPAGDDDGCVRVMMVKDGSKRSVPYGQVRKLTFSGKDTAAGKTWESWVRRYIEKRTAGQSANIESEVLD